MLYQDHFLDWTRARQQALRAEAARYWLGREAQRRQPELERRPRRPRWWPAWRAARLPQAQSGACADAA
jgi:hypothetical protein